MRGTFCNTDSSRHRQSVELRRLAMAVRKPHNSPPTPVSRNPVPAHRAPGLPAAGCSPLNPQPETLASPARSAPEVLAPRIRVWLGGSRRSQLLVFPQDALRTLALAAFNVGNVRPRKVETSRHAECQDASRLTSLSERLAGNSQHRPGSLAGLALRL